MIYFFILISNLFNFNTINEPSVIDYSNLYIAKSEIKPLQVQDSLLVKSMERGSTIYTDFCMQCHMENGSGVAGTFPPLAKADFLNTNTVASIRAVKYGIQGKIVVNGTTYDSAMPSPGLYDYEVADVMNYVLNSWGNKAEGTITEDQVSEVQEKQN